MTKKQLFDALAKYPDDIDLKIMIKPTGPCVQLSEESFMYSTDKAWVDEDAPEGEWDSEDGKIVYDGKPFILFNPIIV